MSKTSWNMAVELVGRFLKQPARLEHLMEKVPEAWDSGTRRACQSLLFGTIRHLRFLEKSLDGFIRKRPKPGVWATLLVASRELMEAPEDRAKVVNHAVDYIGRHYTRAEKGLANAVLRKMPERLKELAGSEPSAPGGLSWRYSHPQWLVERWLGQFGREATQRLLEWNQHEPEIFGRWQRDAQENEAALAVTDWPGFFRIERGAWPRVVPYLNEGRLYVQNPGARLAPTALAERVESGRVLDLCAAPGGKSLMLETLLPSSIEEIVAVDLAGPRFERMEENFRRYRAERTRAARGDVLKIQADDLGQFEGVLLDAPCSNTGVMQHKLDARWRLRPEQIRELVELQRELLEAASRFVAEGGVLVYSTCSIDPEENEGVVERFLESDAGKAFILEHGEVALPWVAGHDGAGVFALRRG